MKKINLIVTYKTRNGIETIRVNEKYMIFD
jgi:hypothetical protein